MSHAACSNSRHCVLQTVNIIASPGVHCAQVTCICRATKAAVLLVTLQQPGDGSTMQALLVWRKDIGAYRKKRLTADTSK